MRVRNITRETLVIKSLKGKYVTLPPLKIVELDEEEFNRVRLKKLFGRYVYILSEEIEEKKDEEVPTKPEENLELEKGEGTIQPTDGTITKDNENEGAGVEGDGADTDIQNPSDDDNELDKLVDDVLEEIEGQDAEEKAPAVEKGKSTKAKGKNNKKNQ